jgi:hypothetical protein
LLTAAECYCRNVQLPLGASFVAGAQLLGLIVLTPIAVCSSAVSLIDAKAARTTAQLMTAPVNDPEIGTRPIDARVPRAARFLRGRPSEILQ